MNVHAGQQVQLMTRSDDAEPESEHSELPGQRVGRLGWLINPDKRRLMLPATGAWILALDWLLFTSNALSAGTATLVVMIIGFVLGSAGTYVIQWRFAGDAPWKAFLKAVLAGVLVGLPWPVGGTLFGGWVLLFSGLGNAKKEFLGR
jgi:hypothetical protein